MIKLNRFPKRLGGKIMAAHVSEKRTEDIALELLNIQGWPTAKPPKGHLVRQNEYKAFVTLADIFKGKSKSGKGDGYPDFLVVSTATIHPYMIIETKASAKEIDNAIEEACFYGDACREAGFPVVVVGVAGQEKSGIKVFVKKFVDGAWDFVTYEGNKISWIPTLKDTETLIASTDVIDLTPIVPRPEILAYYADSMNRVLREANVKDEYRPAYIGAMMLALWESKGAISREPNRVLQDINKYCEQAFSIGGKEELAKSLRVDEANTKLANNAWQIISSLEKLNVVAGSVDHDYLGQLYEQFFRYTGGNTIGQYFTPRHITRFMADICQTSKTDKIIDPACGTGGFLIACIQRAYDELGLKYEDVISLIEANLVGYESEPVTAALCVANMILRGDGRTGIRKDDCFTASDYPLGECQVALMNPPFPHKQTDALPQSFVERALQSLENRGLLAVILPTSLLVKKAIGEWRSDILQSNTLQAVCQLPDELFQPYASATTSIVLLEKGVPHNTKKKTVFVRLQYDGLTLKKGTRVHRTDGKDDIPEAVDAVINRKEVPGFSGLGVVVDDGEWSPGAYIPSGLPTDDELKLSIDELMRRLVSFYVRYAAEIIQQRRRINEGSLLVKPYRDMLTKKRLKNAEKLGDSSGAIGEFFDIYYGQKELHSREGLAPGDSLIISPTEEYNGCYGWLEYNHLQEPPFVTVAQTGTIGEAFVQLEACGVNDDCLVLLPKENKPLPLASYFIAAATIRLESWRFSYGRKLTPSRICDFRMRRNSDLENWAATMWDNWKTVVDNALKIYETSE